MNKYRLGVVLCLLSPIFLTGADWPKFLGPDGLSRTSNTNIPVRWSETENVRWYTKTEGLGWSSPIVVDQRIYFTTAVDIDGDKRKSLRLCCLSWKDGKEIFSKELFREAQEAASVHQKNSHASPTPLAHQGKIYLHFGHEGTACTDLDGNIIWTSREHRYEPTHGNGSSPAIVEDLLILTCDGSENPYTLALNARTGKEVWQVPRNIETDRKFSFCTPTAIRVGDQTQIVSAGSDIIQSLEPSTGKVLWFAKFSGFSLTVRPLFHNGMLYVSTGFMRPKLLAIDPTGQGDVTSTHIRWSHSSNVPNTPSLIDVGSSIVMVSDGGIATAVDADSGKEVWKERLGGNYSSTPFCAGTRIYFQAEDGKCHVLDCSQSKPVEVAVNELPGRIFASYAAVESDLVIRTEQGVYRIGDGSTPF